MKIDGVVVEKVKNFADFKRFIDQTGIKPKHLIIKPNWVEPIEGSYTEAKVLEFLFKAFDCPKTIIESYTFWRTQKWAKSQEDYFSSKEGNLVTGKKHWDHFKNQDKWFLEYTGIGRLLKKHNIDYINITEEVWLGRTVKSEIIKKIVEEKYLLVANKELYSFIPQKISDLRGSFLLSFSKAKTDTENIVTLSTKNLFGLIPDPIRWPKWHGVEEELLPQSIVDINKIYRALFDCYFLSEGIFTALEGPWPNEITPVKNWGMIVGGKNSVEVDAAMAHLTGLNLEEDKPAWFVKAKEVFGDYNKSILDRIPKNYIRRFKKPK